MIRYWCWTLTRGTLTPASLPISRAHWPAQLTTFSQAISPRSVTTPVTRPFSVRMPVTAVSSRMVTPAVRAPRASAWTMSEGEAWPSVGRKAAPMTSSIVISGQRSRASDGVRSCISRPKERAVVAWRLHLGPALGGAGEAEAAVHLPAGGEAGLGLQPVVEGDGVAEELGDVGVGAELADEAGGVPGGAGGELVPLQQDDVGEAHQAEVVGRGAADDAAADDDDLGRCREVGHGRSLKAAQAASKRARFSAV